MEDWRDIIIESDSKVCVDVIYQDLDDGDWNIFVLCNDAKVLAANFSSCLFCWVKREANMMAHTLPKYCFLLIFMLFISLTISQSLWKRLGLEIFDVFLFMLK
jgi:hypothetical protein